MIPGHPNTVRSSPIPLYLQGFKPISYHLGLGQDDVESAIYDAGLDSVPSQSSILTTLDTTPSLYSNTLVEPGDTTSSPYATTLTPPSSAPLSLTPAEISALSMQPGYTPQQLTQLYNSASAAGTMTPAQAASAIAALSTSAAAVAQAASGPAPRVAVPAVTATAPNALTAATIISGVPNYLLLGLAAVAALALGKK